MTAPAGSEPPDALTEPELVTLRHVALIAHGNGHDGLDVAMSQDRVIAAVERILADHRAHYAAALEGAVDKAVALVEAHPVRDAQTRAVTAYQLPAELWRSIRSQLRRAARLGVHGPTTEDKAP